MESRLTKDDYQKLLFNRFGDPELKFIKAELKPISDVKEGYMGEHLKLKLYYSKNEAEFTENFFVKTKPFDADKDHPANATLAYEKEIFFFDFLQKEFEKIGYETSFSAKCYLSCNGDTLIMEDISEKGFATPKRQTYYDIPRVKALLKSLAMLHSGGFCYEKSKSISIVEKYPIIGEEIFLTQYTSGKGFGVHWFKCSIINFKTVLDLLPITDEFRNKFKNYLDKAELGKILIEDHGLKKTCNHGDLWSNNLMFRKQSTHEECCLLDYQVFRYFYPAFDVLLATHCNTNENFRKNHLQDMFQYYYTTFSECVNKYGYSADEFMSYSDFKKGLEICKMDALVQVASVSCFAFVPAEYLNNYSRQKKKSVSKDNQMYTLEDQVANLHKGFLPYAFQNDEIYRKNITTILNDLYDALDKKYGQE